jgi:hypothetical protein
VRPEFACQEIGLAEISRLRLRHKEHRRDRLLHPVRLKAGIRRHTDHLELPGIFQRMRAEVPAQWILSRKKPLRKSLIDHRNVP